MRDFEGHCPYMYMYMHAHITPQQCRRALLTSSPSPSLTSPAKTLVARLAGGLTNTQGRVEVNYNGQGWGTICQNMWTLNNSDVACKMLGFNSANGYTTGSSYGSGLGRIWFDNMKCTGRESNLLDCFSYNGPLVSSCDHTMDIGVACSGEPLCILNVYHVTSVWGCVNLLRIV